MKEMIKWSFKCLCCGYSFKAIEPVDLCNAYTSCVICESKDFEKKVSNENRRHDSKERHA